MALTDNLQAFYKLSDLSDSSGNNRTLTNNNGVAFSAGKLGNAAVFDGSNYLYQSFLNAEINESLTILAWVYPESSGEIKIAGFDRSGQSIYFGIINDGQLFADIGTGAFNGALDESNTLRVTINQWNFVGIRWNQTTKQWTTIVNSSTESLEKQDLSMIAGSILQTYIGAGQEASNSFVGKIDAVGIWNRALSDAEVAELYNSGNGLELNPPNYRGEWDNFTNYGQDDVVSVSGVYWKLTGLGGWTVGGAPGLGYGWTLLGVTPYTVRISGNAKLQGKVKFA
jgi:hypothetical protein